MNPASRQRLLAGFGRAAITPRTGVPLAGFGPYLNRNSTRIHCPLQARCMVLTRDDRNLAILSLELCGLSRGLDDVLRARIERDTGLARNDLLIACTHTHSGPQTAGHIGWGHADDLYRETLPGRIVPAVEAALAARNPVTAAYAEAPCHGIGINRERDTAYDRSQPVEAFLKPAWRPSKPELTDTTCRMLIFNGPGGTPRGILHNYGCHPVVCCEACTSIHGDFVGLASRDFEQAHPGSCALFLPGALGDVNPSVSHRPETESMQALGSISRRYHATLETGLTGQEEIPLAQITNRVWERVLPRVQWDASILEGKIAALEGHLHRHGMTDSPLAGGRHPLERRGIQMVRLAGLRQLRERLESGECLHPPSRFQTLHIGPVSLLCAPLELYHETRIAVEARLPGRPVMLVSLANGSEGYAPDPASYERNPYASEFVNLMGGTLPFSCLHDILVKDFTSLPAT